MAGACDQPGRTPAFFSADAAAREQVVARFEQAWRQGEHPQIEQHLVGEGEDRRALLVGLLHVELEYRLKAGEPARVEEYLQRFPELAGDEQAVVQLVQAEYRLPTDDEWVYACRARTTTAFSLGDKEDLLDRYAVFNKNAKNGPGSV